MAQMPEQMLSKGNQSTVEIKYKPLVIAGLLGSDRPHTLIGAAMAASRVS
jgi:hypothetical protein